MCFTDALGKSGVKVFSSLIKLCFSKRHYEYEQIVVTPVHPVMDLTPQQLNEDNEDFASRRRYHQSSTVQGQLVQIDD